MIEVRARNVRPQLRALFAHTEPASLRCFAVLDGSASGRILTDSPAEPTWAVVQEAGFGSIYLGGKPASAVVHRLVSRLRRDSDVLNGLWPDDERFGLFPTPPDYDGLLLDFGDRRRSEGLGAYVRSVPADCQVRHIDHTLLERCADRDLCVTVFGSVRKALAAGIGVCLMRGDEILCEAFAGPAGLGTIEIGVTTRHDQRQQGYATLVCAHLIQACEERGYRAYWNCAKQNLASQALARKLGYQAERDYRLWAWFKEE